MPNDFMPPVYGGDLTGAAQDYVGQPLVPTEYITDVVQPTVIPQEQSGNAFTRAVARSIDETQAMGAGAAGLIGDLLAQNVSWEPLAEFGGWLKDLGFAEYQRQMDEAAENAPEVGSIENISSPATFMTWLAETAGGLIPSAATFFLSSGAAAVGTQLIGKAVMKKLASSAVRESLKARAKSLAARGITDKVAKRQAMLELIERTAGRKMAGKAAAAATAGGVTASAALESGSNWAQDAVDNGIDNTTPEIDLLFGVASGLTELFGAEAGLLRQITGRSFPKSVEKKAKESITRIIAKGIKNGALKAAGEGTQEFIQGALSELNSNVLRGQYHLTTEDLTGLIDDFAAGAVGGVLFGGAGALHGKFKSAFAMDDERNKINRGAPDTVAEAEDRVDLADKVATDIEDVQVNWTNTRFDTAIQELEVRKASLVPQVAQLYQQGTPESMTEAARLEQEIFSIAGEIANQKKKKEVAAQSLQKQAAWIRNNANKDYQKAVDAEIKASTTTAPVKVRRDLKDLSPQQQAQVDAHATNIERFANSQYTRSVTRLATLTERKSAVEQELLNTEFTNAAQDDFFGLGTDEAARSAEYVKELTKERDALTKDIQNEVKWQRNLFRKAEAASRALAHYGITSGSYIDVALNDLFSLRNDLSPFGAAIENARRQADRAYDAEIRAGERAARDSKRLARQVADSSVHADRMEALRTRAEATEADTLALDELFEQAAGPDLLARRPELPAPFESVDSLLATPPTATPPLAAFDTTTDTLLQGTPAVSGPVATPPRQATAKSAKPKAAQKKRKTTDAVEKVQSHIAHTLNKLPALQKHVTVMPNAEGFKHKLGKKSKAVFVDGHIYMFADKIADKSDAIRTLLHEGVAHFGLRTLFNTKAELDTFLKLVYESMSDTPMFKALRDAYAKVGVKDELDLAEEYIAKLAERVRVGKVLGRKEANVWAKFKTFMRKLLAKAGLKRITQSDINDVIAASIFNLANPKTKALTYHEEIGKVRGSVAYANWVKRGADVKENFNKLRKAWNASRVGTDETGKLIEHTGGERVISSLTDQFRRMLTVQRHLKTRGGKVKHETDVYEKQATYQNRVENAKADFRKKFLSGKNGLIEALAAAQEKGKTPQETFDDAASLAYALHAIERNKSMEARGLGRSDGSGMSTAEAQEIIRNIGKSPQMMAVANIVKQINEYRLDLLEEHSLYPKDVISLWRNTHEWYVPLKGWEEDQKELDINYSLTPKGSNLHAGSWKPSEFAKGRRSKAENPILHSIRQVEDTIMMAEKTRVGRSFLKLVEENKDATDLWQLESDKPRGTTIKLVKDSESGIYRFKAVPKSRPLQGQTSNAFTVIDSKGNKVSIEIKDNALLQALRGSNVAQVGDIAQNVLQTIGKVSRGMAIANTYLNPEFILSNMLRDIQSAALNFTSVKAELKDYNIPKDINTRIAKDMNKSRRALRNALLKNDESGAWGDYFKRFRENGGYTEYLDIHSFESLRKNIVSEVSRLGDQGFTSKAIYKAKDLAKYMENQASVFENMVRLATFKNMTDLLQSQGMDKKAADEKSANIALNLTVNFTRKGTMAPWISPLFMFANAALQANARLMKTLLTKVPGVPFHKQPSTIMVTGFMMMPVVMGMMGRALGGDDEDGIPYYDKIPSYVKNSNMVIMLPGTDGDYLKIPMAYGIHLFTTLGNMLFSMSNDVNAPSASKSAVEVVKAMLGNFSPIGSPDEGWTAFVPTVFRPFAQIETNTNFFGQPIRPEQQFFHKGEMPDSQKYWSNCNSLLVSLADGLNRLFGGTPAKPASIGLFDISPESMEHVLESYTGGAGKFLGKMFGLAQKGFTGQDVMASDVPFVRRLFGDNTYYQTLPLYAEVKNKIETGVNEYDLAKMRDITPQELSEIRADTAKERLANSRLLSVEKRLKALRKRERELAKYYSGSTLIKKQEDIRDRKEHLMKLMLREAKLRGI